jgi:outer membrane protein OmpA-like peptidoglycan-associated protein
MPVGLFRLVINGAIILLIPILFSFDLSANVLFYHVGSRKADKIIEKAQEAISKNQYLEAEYLVLRAIDVDSTNLKSYLLLSDISGELKKNDERIFALKKIISLDSLNFPIAYKLLASILFDRGDYEKAQDIYLHYSMFGIVRDSLLVYNKLKSCQFAISSLSKNRRAHIIHLDSTINTPLQEYWPAISTNDSLLYFTRLIENETHFSYERIFISERRDTAWSTALQMNISDDESVNIGTICLSADGNLLFFTVCGRNDGWGSCDIYYVIKNSDGWSKPINAGSKINSSFWEAQPSVSSDKRFLFFSSNRPGGMGGMDLWYSELSDSTKGVLSFKTPVNMGSEINSRENDFSPFIHADGVSLYFSSEGKFGMGGSDLFLSKLKDSVWSEAVNLGYPICTSFNDDGLVVSPSANVAVFSSNRVGSIDGSKDLYQLELPKEFLPEKVGYIKGFVYNSETRDRMTAQIELTQLESNSTKTIFSDQTNGYITTLVANKIYALNVNVEGFLFYSRHFNLKDTIGFRQAEQVDIFLKPIQSGESIVLSNIFFDFDSDRLKPESDAELDQLKDFLLKNSKVKIEISGHTDNIGNLEYNLKLSEKRARAIFNYLRLYFDQSRMIYKGYGSEQPIDTNESEFGRAKNRRSEIKIL